MGGAGDAELEARTLALADELLRVALASRVGPAAQDEQRLRALLSTESGPRVVFALADRVLRPVGTKVAARSLVEVAHGDLSGLSAGDAALLRAAARVARFAPRPVVALANARFRAEARPYIAPLEDRALTRRLRRLAASGRAANLNILGEAILGSGESERRTAAVERLLRRTDVECVSVKISSIAAGLSLVDFDGSLERAAEPLRRLYRASLEVPGRKLVNLDMEEHRDLDLTVELFTRVLAEEEFARVDAGIALQAYVPESHEALGRLLAFARERRRAGGSQIRVRLVKGANLAMERVEAEIRGWPVPTFATKADTDASYKALLDRLVDAAAEGVCALGVASHNLFDVALALVLAEDRAAPLEIEMLAGMADDQAQAVSERAGRLLFYVPTTARADFRNAVAYLTRRLDENATPSGFLSHVLELRPDSPPWLEQRARFRAAFAARGALASARRQTQDRTASIGRHLQERFSNEPDTDLSVPANRSWARAALALDDLPPVARAGPGEVESAVARARFAQRRWRAVPARRRGELLVAAAELLARRRGEAIGVMAREAGKTFAEGDPEVSEAIDFARYYARAGLELEALPSTLESEPLGVVVVAPPWNFPLAIPAGGVLAALAAGNAVILKPSPEARATGRLLVEVLHETGIDPDCVQLVATDDDSAGRRLVAHEDVGGVVLTGSYETAVLFSRWGPGRRVLAETSGKNAIVVAASADVDLAVRELVRSAFGHAGQKCSASSLAIVEASVLDESPFLRQLADATRALRVGSASDPATEVGPIVGPMTSSLVRALTRLDPGEAWLVEPREVGERLFSPGVRVGVRRGSWAHRTEWFGPVLAVMRARDLDEALLLQNEVEFGLTAGLHSLDPVEHVRFLETVEAGNLYVNRHVTGALVGRQPFGGWKRSSLGPTAKTGGPNYLLGLRRFRDAAPVSLEDAIADYERAHREHFALSHELAGLASESNELRYRPFAPGVTVRIDASTDPAEARKAAAAAAMCGTPVRFSSAVARPDLGELDLEVESAEVLARTLDAYRGRLRVRADPEPVVLAAAAAAGVTVLDEPVCSTGRVELVRWLREQSVSRCLHRYGNVVYQRLDPAVGP